MSKNILIITILIVFIGITVWFFIQKTNKANAPEGLDSLGTSPTPPASASLASSSETNKSAGQWVTLTGGLKIQDIVIGPGREAKAGNVVAAHYTGTLENGTKFDSSYDRGEPFAFILGSGQVIKGWDMGIEGMKIGGKRKFIIPPELAYGDRELGNGLIPANSTLYFEVELLAVQEVKPQ